MEKGPRSVNVGVLKLLISISFRKFEPMKKICFALASLMVILIQGTNAQDTGAHASNIIPPISTREGQVYYQKRWDLPKGITKSEAFLRARQWFTSTFEGAERTLEFTDPEAGVLGGTAWFEVDADAPAGAGGRSPDGGGRIPDAVPGKNGFTGEKGYTGAPGRHFRVKFRLGIRVTDSGYVMTCSHFSEKILDKGITPDFTKIEYRWWDYKNGNPWCAADQALFINLHNHIGNLLASFREDIHVTSGVPPRFRVLALYENGGWHVAYSTRARAWLDALALDSNFRVDYATGTDSINDVFLSKYDLIIQLDFAPYAWKPEAMAAFQKYIEEGRGGWVGFHHATLLGEFDGYPMWDWFSGFMGGIRWKNYIARFAKANLRVEDPDNPVMAGVPATFPIQKEEWYTYDKSPRPNVHVLANVDESSYIPDTSVKMGDHPVIWTNPHVKARNVYIFMGHDPILFDDSNYTRIFRNAIFWASATRPRPVKRFKVLAFYSTDVEPDHVEFARDDVRFYDRLAYETGAYSFDTTSDWNQMNDTVLKNYQVVLWLNEFPHNQAQRTAFEHFIEGGGAWLGFHVSAFNDWGTHWPWLVSFLGGAVFYNNSWPPLTARLIVDDTSHPVTRGIPGRYTGPVNEWYCWKPNPRLDKNVKVLVTLDSTQYPLGKKDRLFTGDIPVVWTNQHYHMLYMNMGHGDQIFDTPVQNRMFANALLWLGAQVKK
jgi:type 1 glutamine amidotransferase